MALKVLVAGLYHLDSGKTVLASSLVYALRREGFKAVGFKPLGVTELWSYPRILEESVRAGALVTRDGLALYKATGAFNPIVLNPVGGIAVPLDPRVFEWRESLMDAALSNPYSRMALARVTFCTMEAPASRHFFNQAACARTARSVREEVEEAAILLRPMPEHTTPRGLAELFENEGGAAADSCLDAVSEKAEVVVAESNSDIAAPTRRLASPDLVVLVARNVAALVNGLRYSKAVELRMRQGKPWTVSTREIASLLAPQRVVELPLKSDPSEGYSASEIEEIVEEVKSLARR
ncbi:MAG: hypothetical protein QXS85_03970 [Acidilobaceae archaeon]